MALIKFYGKATKETDGGSCVFIGWELSHEDASKEFMRSFMKAREQEFIECLGKKGAEGRSAKECHVLKIGYTWPAKSLPWQKARERFMDLFGLALLHKGHLEAFDDGATIEVIGSFKCTTGANAN